MSELSAQIMFHTGMLVLGLMQGLSFAVVSSRGAADLCSWTLQNPGMQTLLAWLVQTEVHAELGIVTSCQQPTRMVSIAADFLATRHACLQLEGDLQRT